MKFFILVLISAPVFACKMTPQSARLKAKETVLNAVAIKTGQNNLHAQRVRGTWIVRTKKPSCREFKMKLDGGKGDCQMTAKILSENPCR